MDACTKGSDHSLDLIVDKNLVQAGLLNIENLTSQGQDSLGSPVSGRLCGTAGRITLNDIDLTLGRILI